MATGIVSPNSGSAPQQSGGKRPVSKSVDKDQLIDRQLRRTRSQVKIVEIAVGVMGLVVALAVFFFVVALIDHWVIHSGLNSGERFLLFSVLIVGAGYWMVTAILPPLIGRVNPIYAAHTIERNKPSLKNSLINFLLFRQQREGLHQVVYNALEQQAAADLSGVHVESAVDRTKLIQLGYALIGCVVAFALYFVLSPKDPFTTVQRVVLPWTDVPVPARVSILDIRPGNATVFRGQPVQVSAEIQGLGAEENVKLLYTTADRQIVDEAIALHIPEGYRHTGVMPKEKEGIQQDLDYRIEAGDATSSVYHVHVVPAPTIVVDRVDYQYPAYTGLDPVTVSHHGDLKAVEGTQVILHAVANQPIKSASIDFNCDGKPDGAMKVDGQNATCSFVLLLNNARTGPQYDSYQLRIVNPQGAENPEPIKHRIEVEPDLPPEVTFLNPQQEETEVSLNGQITIEVRAIDPDFALTSVVLRAKTERGNLLDQALMPEGSHVGPFNGKYQFEPSKLGLKEGDIVRYWAVAVDNKSPDANQTTTPERRIRIVAAENATQRQQANPLAQNDQPKDQPNNSQSQSAPRNDGQPQNHSQENHASKNDDSQLQNAQSQKPPHADDDQKHNNNDRSLDGDNSNNSQQPTNNQTQPNQPNNKPLGDQSAAPLADKPKPNQSPDSKNNLQNNQRNQNVDHPNDPRNTDTQKSNQQQSNGQQQEGQQKDQSSDNQNSGQNNQQENKNNQQKSNGNQNKQSGNSRGGQSGKGGSQQADSNSSQNNSDQSQSKQNGASSGTQNGQQSSGGTQNNSEQSGSRSSSSDSRSQPGGQSKQNSSVPSDGSDDGTGVERILQQFQRQDSKSDANQNGQPGDQHQNGMDKEQPSGQSPENSSSKKQPSDKSSAPKSEDNDKTGMKSDKPNASAQPDSKDSKGDNSTKGNSGNTKPNGADSGSKSDSNKSDSSKSDGGKSDKNQSANTQPGKNDADQPASANGKSENSKSGSEKSDTSKTDQGGSAQEKTNLDKSDNNAKSNSQQLKPNGEQPNQHSGNGQQNGGGQQNGRGQKNPDGKPAGDQSNSENGQTQNGQKSDDGQKSGSNQKSDGQKPGDQKSDGSQKSDNGQKSDNAQQPRNDSKPAGGSSGSEKQPGSQPQKPADQPPSGNAEQSSNPQKTGDQPASKPDGNSSQGDSKPPTDSNQQQDKSAQQSPSGNSDQSQQKQPDGSGNPTSKSDSDQSNSNPQNSSSPPPNSQSHDQSSDHSGKPSDSSPQNAQSPSNSQRPSNARGQQDGDRSGNGGQGGGQGSKSQGRGSAGQNTPSDSGSGKSEQPGNGESSQKPGGDQKSDQPTGQQGNEKGNGSSSRNSNGSDSKSSGGDSKSSGSDSKSNPDSKSNEKSQYQNQPDSNSSGSGSPSSDSDSSSSSQDQSSTHSQANPSNNRNNPTDPKSGDQPPKTDDSQPAPSRFKANPQKPDDSRYPQPPSEGAAADGMGGLGNGNSGAHADGPQTKPDAANLNYAKKATELALDHLKNAMKNGRDGDRLLKDLGWSRAEAEDFIRRQEQRLRDAERPDPNDPTRREAEDALRSLGLRPDRTDRSGNTLTSDNQRGMSSGRHTTPPPEYQEQFKAYSQGINSGK